MRARIITLILLSYFTMSVKASIITYKFDGVVSYIKDDSSIVANEIELSTPFTGYFTYNYDTTIPEQSSFINDPTTAFYPVISDTKFYIGNYLVEGRTEGSYPKSVQIWNDRDDSWPPMDLFSISSGLDYDPPFDLGEGNTLTTSFTLSLYDSTATVFEKLVLPSPEQINLNYCDRISFGMLAVNHDQ